MGHYSIKQLEGLSGIKAHTIRIWEKRYKLLEPKRSETNIRHYDDEHLKKLLNVSLLNNNGLKISKIADFSETEIETKVKSLSNSANPDLITDNHIKELLIALLKLDESVFNDIVDNYQIKHGFYQTISKIIYPLLNSMGLLWGINKVNPAQEHFISNLIRQKIIASINNINNQPSKNKTFILYLPENELHEIGLLTAHYFLKNAGYKVFYLGQNVPLRDLFSIINNVNPDVVLTFITTKISEQKINSHFDKIVSTFPNLEIWLSGYIQNLSKITLNKRITSILSVDDFLSKIVFV